MPRIPESQSEIDALVADLVGGSRRVLARLLRLVDDDAAFGRKLALHLQPHIRPTQIIGITGNPGAGKSTVVDAMLKALRAEGKRVAVLAIDPSSPFSGGAILGDRIRMNAHFDDEGVYIRSLATRGALGGLSRSTFDSVRVLEASAFDVVLIETVGVGQDEVDVVRLADTTVVIVVPGLGDDIQAIKAGLLEIADIFLINKADRAGADDVESGLRQLLTLAPPADAWEPPILRSVALRNEGISELLENIGQHVSYLSGPEGLRRRRARHQDLFNRLLDAALIERGRSKLGVAVTESVSRLWGDVTPDDSGSLSGAQLSTGIALPSDIEPHIESEIGADPYVEVERLLGVLA